MAGGGWKNCCCAVIGYDFCEPDPEPVFPDDPWWDLNFDKRYRTGTWKIFPSSCKIGESTGIGQLISTVPLAPWMSLSVSVLNETTIGDIYRIYLNWNDDGDYLEMRATITAANNVTLSLWQGGALLTECPDQPYGIGSPIIQIDACIGQDIFIGSFGLASITLSNISPGAGTRAGIGHNTSHSVYYKSFVAQENDPPSGTLCGGCGICKCIKEDGTEYRIPLTLRATIIGYDACSNLTGLTWLVTSSISPCGTPMGGWSGPVNAGCLSDYSDGIGFHSLITRLACGVSDPSVPGSAWQMWWNDSAGGGVFPFNLDCMPVPSPISCKPEESSCNPFVVTFEADVTINNEPGPYVGPECPDYTHTDGLNDCETCGPGLPPKTSRRVHFKVVFTNASP